MGLGKTVQSIAFLSYLAEVCFLVITRCTAERLCRLSCDWVSRFRLELEVGVKMFQNFDVIIQSDDGKTLMAITVIVSCTSSSVSKAY